MRFTHSRVRPSARYDSCRRVARFSSPLYAVDGDANVSLSCRLAGFLCSPPLVLLSLPPSLSLSLFVFRFLSLSRSLPFLPLRRVFLSKGSDRYLEENSLFSPATEEIPPCSIAGEHGRIEERERRRSGRGRSKSSATWLEEKLLRFRILCVCVYVRARVLA